MLISSEIKVWVKRVLKSVNKDNSQVKLEERLYITNVVLQMEILEVIKSL